MKRTIRTDAQITGILPGHEPGANRAGLCRRHGMAKDTSGPGRGAGQWVELHFSAPRKTMQTAIFESPDGGMRAAFPNRTLVRNLAHARDRIAARVACYATGWHRSALGRQAPQVSPCS